MAPTVVFIAGDPSGDRHAAGILRALKTANPQVECTGIGGPAMSAEGFTPLMPFEPFNRMGFLEVFLHLLFFLNARRYLISFLKKTSPACLVCVDYSGFNIPMMKSAHALGIPVVWYIAPMVWAWKKKRAAVLARYTSEICCIFPFEVPFFKKYTENVHFAGNPVVEAMGENDLPGGVRKEITQPPRVALVPGSRPQEIVKNLPPMVGALRLLKEKYPGCTGVVSRYPGLPLSLFKEMCPDLEIHTGTLMDLFTGADCAIITSGTATLEAALMGVPHVVIYKTSPFTYALFKYFLTISFIGLPNIIAGESVVPECIQETVTPENLFSLTSRYFDDRDFYESTKGRLVKIRELLGSVRPSAYVAGLIRRYIN